MKSISGPINIFRLEGQSNKVLYLFADVHTIVSKQTECENIDGINITNFIIDTLKEHKESKINKTFDVFVERDPMIPNYINPAFKGRYYDELINLYNMFNDKDTKNINNETFGCRFHYVDIRSYFINKLTELVDKFYRLGQLMWQNNKFSTYKITNLRDCLIIIKSYIVKLYNTIYINNQIKEDILVDLVEGEYDQAAKKIIHKIGMSTNNTIKEIVKVELEREFRESLIVFDGHIKYLEEVYNKHSSDPEPVGITLEENLAVLSKIKVIGSQLYDIIYGKFSATIMDLYFISRFINKPYITNSLLYAGANHIMSIMRLLVKYYKFKVTNYSYLDNKESNTDINTIIQSTGHYKELRSYLYPPRLTQCSIYNQKFPKLFL